jgi:REP element-mobilizing transposase RayT
MSIKQQISEANGVYFITVTCHGWMNLFDMANAYDAVYNWFNVLKKKGHYIPAYVIMPNHFHVLIAFSGVSTNINRVVGKGKRFRAFDFLQKFKNKNAANILNPIITSSYGI